MIKQTVIDLDYTESEHEKPIPSYVYHTLTDGRIVPVEMGGLVELALFELGGQLVEVVDEYATTPPSGLN
jgi:hypothetical protein